MFPTDLSGCVSIRYVFCKCFQTNGNLQLRILTVCFLLTLPVACIYGVLLKNTLKQLFPVTCVPMWYVFAYIPMRYIFRWYFQKNRCFWSNARRCGMFISGRFRLRANAVCFLRLFMFRLTAKNKGSVPNMGKNVCVIPLQTTACQK